LSLIQVACGEVATDTASVPANSASNSNALRSRSRADSESSPDKRDSIFSPIDEGKLKPAAALFSNVGRREYSGHTSASCIAQDLVNQITIATCGRDSSIALVDAHV